MQYALVDNHRMEAFPGGRGKCPLCGADTIAKCGPRVINHWAHFPRRDCDAWWENETPWHREWKNKYPEECREISYTAPNGEIHRCDIKTPTGIFIEVQHSSMSDDERRAREDFYDNLVWIIDGRGFSDNFLIFHMLPDPSSELAKDLVWVKAKKELIGASRGIFYRRSEIQPGDSMVHLHSIKEIEDELHEFYVGHHQYDWIKPRNTWLEANRPVYIDFGNEYLVRLEIYDESGLPCIRLVSKRKFIHDTINEISVYDIGTRFYPLP